MTEFLLFTLYAPLASWGEIAVGEARGSWDRPSRSAVLGLLAAALGVTRDDQEAHDALGAGYGVAVRLDAPGTMLSDYHTAQTIAAAAVKKSRPTTRAELLASGEPETILSRRAYRQDAVATVALWARPEARWTLARLAEALRHPAFVLYAGRKATPFGAPLDPALVEAGSLADALATRPAGVRGLSDGVLRGRRAWGREVSHDPCDGFASGLELLRRETRRDVPIHRERWQFAERVVEISLAGPPADPAAEAS